MLSWSIIDRNLNLTHSWSLLRNIFFMLDEHGSVSFCVLHVSHSFIYALKMAQFLCVYVRVNHLIIYLFKMAQVLCVYVLLSNLIIYLLKMAQVVYVYVRVNHLFIEVKALNRKSYHYRTTRDLLRDNSCVLNHLAS